MESPAPASRWARSSSSVTSLPLHLCAQQALVPEQEAGWVATAVRARCQVLAGALEGQHLIAEGAGSFGVGYLADGAIASEGGD